MTIGLIQAAINAQGIAAAWRGPAPIAGSVLTDDYVAELVDGLPRIVYAEQETQAVDVGALAQAYDALLDTANDSAIRAGTIAAIKSLALERIGARIEALADLVMIAMVVELVQAGMLNPPALGSDAAACAEIYSYAKAKIQLAKTAPIDQVAAYDPAADAQFPA